MREGKGDLECPADDDRQPSVGIWSAGVGGTGAGHEKAVVMTRQESFKRRIRARMEQTGERYAAARRMLIQQASQRTRTWVSEPEMSDAAIRENTGHGWDEWVDLIEAWPGRDDGHAAIATWVQSEHGIDGWWAQSVTVGYERIVGIRLPHQMADGTFTANKSKTITTDADVIDKMLRHPDDHADLFPAHETELRSRPDAKSVRIGMGGGVAIFDVQPRENGRCKVVVMHEKLPSLDAVEQWKFFWQEWLDALDES